MALSYPNLRLRRTDGSGHGTRVHLQAVVARVFPDAYAHDGADHEHLWITQLSVLEGGIDPDPQDNVFVAVRVTPDGIGVMIPFEVGAPVEFQGLWIDADHAEAGPDNPGLAVLHFTHRPVGFVVYDGQRYE